MLSAGMTIPQMETEIARLKKEHDLAGWRRVKAYDDQWDARVREAESMERPRYR